MPENAPMNEVPVFMRSYRNAVDAQWRVTVPSTWRFAERANLFIRVKNSCLVVITRMEMDRFLRNAEQHKGTDRTALLQAWADTVEQTKIDSAGRLTLPKEWAQGVGIKAGSKVVLAGATENFQIWAEDQYDNDQEGIRSRGRALLSQYD